MASFGQLKLTDLGIMAQLNAQNGKPLKFTKIGVGSGVFAGDVSHITKLVKEEVLIGIDDAYMEDTVYTVSGSFSNENMDTSFVWREIGLYFEDEKGNNVLYCYANAGDRYDVIPATTDSRYTKTVRVATAISNAANVSVQASSGTVYVEVAPYEKFKKNVEDHMKATNPHGTKASDLGALSLDGGTIKGLLELLSTLVSNTEQAIPVKIKRTTKGNNDLDWYQDIQFMNKDDVRVGVLRSQVNVGGDRVMLIGVSDANNIAPGGLEVIRGKDANYVIAKATSNNHPEVVQIVNSYAGMASMAAGSSSLVNNCIYEQYE